MSVRGCPHSNLAIAKHFLELEGHISAYEAVYVVRCPWCGVVRRNTRLAATIYTLRHEAGLSIVTHQKSGQLADYVLFTGFWE